MFTNVQRKNLVDVSLHRIVGLPQFSNVRQAFTRNQFRRIETRNILPDQYHTGLRAEVTSEGNSIFVAFSPFEEDLQNEDEYELISHESVHVVQEEQMRLGVRPARQVTLRGILSVLMGNEPPHEQEAYSYEQSGGRFLRNVLSVDADIKDINDPVVRTSHLNNALRRIKRNLESDLETSDRINDTSSVREIATQLEDLNRTISVVEERLANLQTRTEQAHQEE